MGGVALYIIYHAWAESFNGIASIEITKNFQHPTLLWTCHIRSHACPSLASPDTAEILNLCRICDLRVLISVKFSPCQHNFAPIPIYLRISPVYLRINNNNLNLFWCVILAFDQRKFFNFISNLCLKIINTQLYSIGHFNFPTINVIISGQFY